MIEKVDNDWHLDKKVPIAVILTLIIQTVSIGWWASKVESRIGQLESADIRSDRRSDGFDQSMRASDLASTVRDVRITRLEERVTAIYDRLERMERKLDQLVDAQRGTSPR